MILKCHARRCWFHRWAHVAYVGLADLREHERCTKCGKERVVRIAP